MSIGPEPCAGKLVSVVQHDLPKLGKNYSIGFLLPQHPSDMITLKAGDLLSPIYLAGFFPFSVPKVMVMILFAQSHLTDERIQLYSF